MVLWNTTRIYGIVAFLAVLALGAWLFLSRWTPEEAVNAQHFQQAMLEVRDAIAYANERGGMIDPSATENLIGRYSVAAEHAVQVTDQALNKLHPNLNKVWHEVFLPSTHLYLRAFKNQDLDLAHHASLLQDDWVRWLRLNGHNLDIPDPPPAVSP